MQNPRRAGDATLPIPPGYLRPGDLCALPALDRQGPRPIGYRGYDVYGMAPSSSGGSTVGEALNILERSGCAG